MGEKEYTNLDYDRIVHETDMAYLLDFGDDEKWVPKSLIDPNFLPLEEEGGEVAVEEWFANKEEL